MSRWGIEREGRPYRLHEVLPPLLWVQSGCKVVVHGYARDAAMQVYNAFRAWRMSKTGTGVELKCRY